MNGNEQNNQNSVQPVEQENVSENTSVRKSNKKTYIWSSIALLILLGIIVIGFLGYRQLLSPSDSTSLNSGQDKTPIIIGRGYWPGNFWIDIADKKGFFTQAGLQIKVIDVSSNYTQSLQDMVDGKIDVHNFTLYDLIKFNAQGADIVGVLASDHSTGGEGMAARQTIQTVNDLKGKKIGVTKGTYLEYVFDEVSRRYNLDPSDYTIVDIIPEQALDELNANTVDAVVVYEPFLSQVLKDTKYHKLFDTSEAIGLVTDIEVFHQSFIDKRPDDVEKFVQVWNQTTEYMKNNPKEAYSIIAEVNKVTPSEVEDFTKVDKILDLQDNLTVFSYSAGASSLYNSAEQINDFLLTKKLTDKRLDPETYLNAKFIKSL